MDKLRLEVSDEHVPGDGVLMGGALMLTPAINEDYWMFRVKLHEQQAIIGFSKFTTIGIGFAIEDDWNTNLPYTCETAYIYDHIKHNKKYDEITDEQCIEAIEMVQEAARRFKGEIA